jgi:exodeoxyribonuclease VII small subunit
MQLTLITPRARQVPLAEKNSPSDPPEEPDASFEVSLDKLDQVVKQLEEGQLGLTESLERYEEGVKHLKQCYRALEKAERKIELLSGVDSDGNPITEPFDDQEMTLDQKAAARTSRRSSRSNQAADPSDAENTDTQPGLF